MAEMERKSTLKPGMALIGIAVVIAIACALGAVYLYNNPEVLNGIVSTIALAVMAIVAIAAVAYIVYMIVAVFYYASKGEVTQTDISYNMDDVKPVKESSSEDDED